MHRFIIWTYCASGQTDGSWHKGTDLNRVEHYNGLLLHINAENQRVCCAVESTYMLNVEGHLTMSSKGMLGGGGKTRKWGYSKSESVIGPVSSFHCNKMQRKWFLNSFFLRISSSLTSSRVIFQLQALLFWLEDVIVHTRQRTQKVFSRLGTTNHSSLQDRRRWKGIDKSTKQSLTKLFSIVPGISLRLSIKQSKTNTCELSPNC